MPDVSRSDSQRSDSSARPRVSFNRDVHVKRIGNPAAPRVIGALSGDGAGRFVPLPVRRERPTRLSKRELAKEARKVLEQVDTVSCTAQPPTKDRTWFNTLPPIRSHARIQKRSENDSPSDSLDRSSKKKRGRNFVTSVFSSLDRSIYKKKKEDRENKSGLSDFRANTIADRPDKKQRAGVRRSVSDVGTKPIIAKKERVVTNFGSLDRASKRNREKSYSDPNEDQPKRSALKENYSDPEIKTPPQNQTDHYLYVRNKKQLSPIIEASPKEDYFENDIFRKDSGVNMNYRGMHSSQAPASKPTLTRGQTVESIVRRLSKENRAGRGPPKIVNPTTLVTPDDVRKHNNNLPFSYTEPTLSSSLLNDHSPTLPADSSRTPTDGQVIYAEVVVGGGGSGKQTVHTKVPTFNRQSEGSNQSPNKAVDNGRAESSDEGTGQDKSFYSKVISPRNNSDNYASVGKREETYDKGFLEQEKNYYYNKNDLVNNREYVKNTRNQRENMVREKFAVKKSMNIDERGRGDGMDYRRKYSDEYLDRYGNYEEDQSDKIMRFFSDSRISVDDYAKRDYSPAGESLIEPKIISGRDRKIQGRDHRFAYENSMEFKGVVENGVNRTDYATIKGGYDDDYRKYERSRRSEKKEMLVDSGIETDYRKDSMGKYKSNYGARNSSDRMKAKIYINSNESVIRNSDVVDQSEDELVEKQYIYGNKRNVDNRGMFTSTRLVKEGRKAADVVPSSSVLIKHYAPDTKATKNKEDSKYKRNDKYSTDEEQDKRKDTVKKFEKKINKKGVTPMSRVKQLFSRGTNKKEKMKKEEKEEDEVVYSRYKEYKGRNIESDGGGTIRSRKASPDRMAVSDIELSRSNIHPDYGRTRRVTSSPRSRVAESTTALNRRNSLKSKENGNVGGSWFKSLDRISRKSKQKSKSEINVTDSEKSDITKSSNKNLRFFGDTDKESVTSIPVQNYNRINSPNDFSGSSNRLQVPRSGSSLRNHKRLHRSTGDVANSSAESTTEGDSSQHSNRSVVYLHAATVGDIPSTDALRGTSRRSQSREELSSLSSSRLQPRIRTVSRSISVLAPWKPRHYREGIDIYYNNTDNTGKPPKVPQNYASRGGKKDQKTKKSQSVESLGYMNGQQRNKINNKVKRTDSFNKQNNKNGSVISLNKGGKIPYSLTDTGDEYDSYGDGGKDYGTLKQEGKTKSGISRSISMPKDNSRLTSGWFGKRREKKHVP